MNTDKIKKIFNNKYFDLVLVIAINFVFVVLFNCFYQPKYEINDDFIIMNLISKADGNYSIYGIYMHPIICMIIIALFKTGINLNWYSIFLLAIQFISFTIIGTIFLKRNRKLGLIIYLTFIVVFYSKLLRLLQYTSVAALSIAAGIILLMYSLDNIKSKHKNIYIGLSILLIAIGSMIRFDVGIIGLPFILVYFLMRHRDKKGMLILLIVFLVLLMVKLSNIIIYNINPVYKEYNKFNSVRTYFHDYNKVGYSQNEEMFKSANLSKNDRDIFYAYCFGDENVFNTQTLTTLKNNYNKPNDTFNRITNLFSSFMSEVKNNYFWIYIFLIALILFNNVINIKNSNILLLNNLNFILILLLNMAIIFINRPMFRVVISVYIIGISCVIYFILNEDIKFKKPSTILFIIAIIIVLMFSYKEERDVLENYNINSCREYKEVEEYTSSHKENAYLYTLTTHNRFLAYSVYEKIPDDYYSNLQSLGDWDTYTQNYYNFKQRYQIDNLITDLYKKDNVYLIAGKVIWGEPYDDYVNIIIKFIKEHYNVDIDYEVVKEFKNDIKIYKLYENK